MRYLYILVLILIQIFSYSQNATITVVDKETKKVLPYVNICFESLINSKKDYTTTNMQGEAENKCSDKCVISLSFVGYKTLFDTLNSLQSKTYELQADVFNLEQVVVTATRTEKALKDAPVITQVITSKDIDNRGVNNVKQIIEEDIPGVEMQRGGFGADIKMQGLESRNILILIDGERIAGETGNNIDYSRLNASNVERVEIIKGAASALYGSQAMGGVINIITKKTRKKLEISAGMQATQFNEINFPDLKYEDENYNFKKNLDLPNLNFNASVGFNIKNFSGRTDFVAKSFDAYQLYNTNIVVKDYINLDTVIYDSLSLFPKGIQGYKDITISQKLSIPLHKKLILNMNGTYYTHNEYDFVPDKKYLNFIDYTFGGNLIYSISKDFSITASYHQDIYDKYDFYERLFEKNKVYRNTFINPKLVSSFKIKKKQFITAGFEYLNEYMQSGLFIADSIASHTMNTSVFFVQDDIQFNKKWNAVVGGRIDNHSVFGTYMSPKLSTMYKLKHLSFRMNYAKGFRSPTAKELYMNWDIAWFTIKGSESLQPETNDYLSFSTEYTKSWLNTSINIYKNWLQNKIDGEWDYSMPRPVYQYKNAKHVELSGFEILSKIKFLKHFMLSGAYSYLNDNRPQADLVSSTSPHTGNIKLSYQYTKKRYEINIMLSTTIIGAKEFDKEETVFFRGDTLIGTYHVYYDAYSMWKLVVNQRLFNAVDLTIGVENLFDYRPTIIDFNTSMSPGRRGFVSLKIDVDNFFGRKKKKKTASK